MCDPVTLGMTALQATTQLQAGRNAAAQGAMQQQVLDAQAQQEQDAAAQTAALVRRAGRRQVGEANAAFAGAGVRVGDGSAGEVERQINMDVEHDAFQALLDGSRRAGALRVQGVAAREAGRAQRAAANVSAVGTVLGSGYNAMKASGWRSQGPGWSGTQMPAPVETRVPVLTGRG